MSPEAIEYFAECMVRAAKRRLAKMKQQAVHQICEVVGNKFEHPHLLERSETK